MSAESIDSIKILEVITADVSEPSLDGSPLYAIPFRLNRAPSERWADFFIEAWNLPPQSTLKHRPGIASVQGDRIVLDGTSMEEVRDYHQSTLRLCVSQANQKEAEAIQRDRAAEERRRREVDEHRKNVDELGNTITFD